MKRSLQEIDPNVLEGRFRSKADFYYYLRYEGKQFSWLTPVIVQRYLPPVELVSKDFLRDVFRDKKKLFKLSEVNRIEVPLYDELSVDNMMAEYSRDEEFMTYLPVVKAKGKRQCREYMFNIFNSLYPQTLKSIIADAKQKRVGRRVNEDKKEVIQMDQGWLEELKAMPFKSSKCSGHFIYV